MRLLGNDGRVREEFAKFLVEEGLGRTSFNPEALLQGIKNIYKAEVDLTIEAIGAHRSSRCGFDAFNAGRRIDALAGIAEEVKYKFGCFVLRAK